jgi:NTE family protein
MSKGQRTGLALGAGGILGGAWLAGTLAALAGATGWNPALAELVLGTSAGSVFAALTAGGVAAGRLLPPAAADLAAREGWPLAELAAGEPDRAPWRWPGRGSPGSPRMILRGLRERAVLRAVSGLMPRGLVPTAAIEATVRQAVPAGWMRRPACWIVACDYATGERVVFGRPGAPRPPLAAAVAASCAIPGFYAPVTFEGRQYVDGGLHSLSNLDLLGRGRVDLVVALNPMSGDGARGGWSPMGRLTAAMRRWASRRVAAEVAALRARGVEVLLLEPSAADLEAMGDDLMAAGRAALVAEVAQATAAAAFRRPALQPLLRRLAR